MGDGCRALARVHAKRHVDEASHSLVGAGVDMFNHDSERYNCIVRVVTSPDTCQGAQATDEIAPSMSTSTRDEEIFRTCRRSRRRKRLRTGTSS